MATADQAGAILRGLGFIAAPVQPGEPTAWRRRGEPAARAGQPHAASPFAALAALRPAAAPVRRKRPRRRPKARA